MTAAASRDDLPAMRALLRGHELMQAMTAQGAKLVAEMLDDYDARDLAVPGQGLPAAAACIAGLTIPVLAIVGAADTAQRLSNALALADVGAKAVTLPRAGHLCNIDEVDEYNAALRANSFGAGL